MWRKTIFNMADGIITPCNVTRSWHWFRQVTAPCNVACGSGIVTVNSPSGSTCSVIRGSGMTCHWIRPVAAPCNVKRSSGIMTLNSPRGSTLQCGRWLWDDMPLNSPKHPPYWNSTSSFDFDNITTVDMSFCTSLRNFIQIGPPSAGKMTSRRFSRWRISAILDFSGPVMGSLKSPCTTSYRYHSSKLLSFWENRVFLHFSDRQRNRQTDKQMDIIDALSRSRCRERQLNKHG